MIRSSASIESVSSKVSALLNLLNWCQSKYGSFECAFVKVLNRAARSYVGLAGLQL